MTTNMNDAIWISTVVLTNILLSVPGPNPRCCVAFSGLSFSEDFRRLVGGPGVRQAEVQIPPLPCVWFVTLGKALNRTQFLVLTLHKLGVIISISQNIGGIK